jgi:hypothetical protein
LVIGSGSIFLVMIKYSIYPDLCQLIFETLH